MADFDIDIGDLDKRINLQVNSGSPNSQSAGQEEENWSDGTTYWAAVKPLSGRDLWNARQLQATTTHQITMRNVGVLIKPGHRFIITDPVFGTRMLYVDAVHRVGEQNEFLLIEASEPKNLS